MKTIQVKTFVDGLESKCVVLVSKEPHKNFSPISVPAQGDWTVHFHKEGEPQDIQGITAPIHILYAMFPGWESLPNKERWVTILINLKGEEFYLCYGGHSKNFSEAVRFASEQVANGAGPAYFGFRKSFWDCERQSAEADKKRYHGWTHRVINAYDSDNYKLKEGT